MGFPHWTICSGHFGLYSLPDIATIKTWTYESDRRDEGRNGENYLLALSVPSGSRYLTKDGGPFVVQTCLQNKCFCKICYDEWSLDEENSVSHRLSPEEELDQLLDGKLAIIRGSHLTMYTCQCTFAGYNYEGGVKQIFTGPNPFELWLALF